jgi:hypothetical protein
MNNPMKKTCPLTASPDARCPLLKSKESDMIEISPFTAPAILSLITPALAYLILMGMNLVNAESAGSPFWKQLILASATLLPVFLVIECVRHVGQRRAHFRKTVYSMNFILMLGAILALFI